MGYGIHKLTFSAEEAYRYQIYNGTGRLRYQAERLDARLPLPTYRVRFLDPAGSAIAQLSALEENPWIFERTYLLRMAGTTGPDYVIRREWPFVDEALLRLPHYYVELGPRIYLAHGSRYGQHFYSIHRLQDGAVVGEILRPTSGYHYWIETEAPVLQQAPLLLVALVVVIDMEWEMVLERA